MALHVIRLVNPSDCLRCRFASIAMSETDRGPKSMLHCGRLDFDNWILPDTPPPDPDDTRGMEQFDPLHDLGGWDEQWGDARD
jgi:hypothetical protein